MDLEGCCLGNKKLPSAEAKRQVLLDTHGGHSQLWTFTILGSTMVALIPLPQLQLGSASPLPIPTMQSGNKNWKGGNADCPVYMNAHTVWQYFVMNRDHGPAKDKHFLMSCWEVDNCL